MIALSLVACRAALCQTPPPISLTNVNPPSTLLAPGATSLNLSFNTPQPDTCGYSVGTLLELSQMLPIDIAGPTATHQVTVMEWVTMAGGYWLPASTSTSGGSR